MTVDAVVLFAHVMGAVVLAGTGAGIAFFMLIAHRSRDAAFIARTAATVTLADWLFTATAVVAQPVTGTWLAIARGWSLDAGWLAWSGVLYAFVVVLWLPVVALQYRLKRLAEAAMEGDGVLSPDYHSAFRLWFALGVPAFLAILALLWLMLHKPVL